MAAEVVVVGAAPQAAAPVEQPLRGPACMRRRSHMQASGSRRTGQPEGTGADGRVASGGAEVRRMVRLMAGGGWGSVQLRGCCRAAGRPGCRLESTGENMACLFRVGSCSKASWGMRPAARRRRGEGHETRECRLLLSQYGGRVSCNRGGG